jgi:peroxiredoxin
MKIAAASLASLLLATVSLIAADAPAGRKAPELAFNLPGQGQKLLSQYRGKVVALEFIFTTCPHCQAASHVMSRFQQEFGSQGFQAIDIAVNDNADLLVENFAKDYKVAFPVGWISREQMMSFMGIKPDVRWVVPQLVLIDRKGYIRYQTPPTESDDWDKLMKEDALKQHIEELLGTSSSAKRIVPASNGHIALAKKPS